MFCNLSSITIKMPGSSQHQRTSIQDSEIYLRKIESINNFEYKQLQMNLDYDEYEEYFKVIVVGNSGTGKTNIIHTFDKGIKPNHTAPTVGVDYCSKTVNVDQNQKVKLQIWDTAGQEQYRSITMGHYKNALGALIVFDVTNKVSFNELARWIYDVRERSDENVVIGIVGNKTDSQNRAVSRDEGQNYANRQRAFYMQTTVFEPQTVRNVFERLGQQIYRAKRNKTLNFSNDSIVLDKKQNTNNCQC